MTDTPELMDALAILDPLKGSAYHKYARNRVIWSHANGGSEHATRVAESIREAFEDALLSKAVS